MHIFKKIFKIIFEFIPLKIRNCFNNNHDFTVISRNCIGGILYHQYGLKFLSPTINLFFDLSEFNFFCNNLVEYINGTITKKDHNAGIITPTSPTLPSIIVWFEHYPSFEEGLNKWEERKKRINWNNIFIINSCTGKYWRDSVTEDIISNFNKIPYKKVIFTERKYGFDGEFVLSVKDEFCKKPLSWKYGFNQFGFNRFLRKKK